MQRLHVVLERGTGEQADLCDIRRAESRLAALPLDGFDHRRLFAADVGTSATSKMEPWNPARGIVAKAGELALQDGAAAVVFVAQVDINVVNAYRPRGDDCAFEKTVGIALEVIAILERPRLAFVDVDRHQTRSRFRCDDLPLAAGGEAGATKAAQPRVFHQRDDVCHGSFAVHTRCRERVPAGCPVRRVINVARRHQRVRRGMRDCSRPNERDDILRRGVRHWILTHDGNRRGIAATDARRRKHADVWAEHRRQHFEQLTRARKLAGD